MHLSVSKAHKSIIEIDMEIERDRINVSCNQNENFILSKSNIVALDLVLYNINLKPFLATEDRYGRWTIHDYSNDLFVLLSFMKNKFPLPNLTLNKEFSGKYFNELSGRFQTRIEDFSVQLYIIKNTDIDKNLFDYIASYYTLIE